MKDVLKIFADDNAGYEAVKRKLEQQLPNTGAGASVDTMNIINYFLYAIGLIAVVMIIVAGVQMTTSAGDAGAVAKAKKTLTFSVIGLIVAILAYAIVNFVLAKVQ